MVKNLQEAVHDSDNADLKFNRDRLAEEESKHTSLVTTIENLKMERKRREAEIEQKLMREAERKKQEQEPRLESGRKKPLSLSKIEKIEKKLVELDGNFELFCKLTDQKFTYLFMLVQKLCDGTYPLLKFIYY